MEYLTKLIIDGQEIGEGGAVGTPSISSMKLVNNACLTSIDIGATAADCLTFTLNNPPKASFDGDKVELFISKIESDQETTKERIENEVGTEASDEGVDEDDIEGVDDDEDGEDLTDDELAELEEYDEELVEIQTVILEGEDEAGPEEITAEEEEPEWIPFGVYYVYQQVNSDNSVTLTCYDAFSLMNGIHTLGTATWTEHWTALSSQLQAVGIELDAYEFERGTDVITIKSGSTIRDTLGILCGYAGGYATCDTDGSVGISFFSYADKILIESDLISIRDTSAGEALIDGVICYDDRGYSIESTSGSATISMTNYAVTQEVLDEVIAPLYKGIRFGGAVASVDWDDELRAGEFIRVMSEDEYAAYLELDNSTEDTRAQRNELGRVLLISSQEITFGSNVTAIINSTAEAESAKAKYTYPPMLKKIIEAGQTATNYITEDDTGALVIKRATDNYNVRIDADSLEVREGDTVLASFGEEVHLLGDRVRIEADPARHNVAKMTVKNANSTGESDVTILGGAVAIEQTFKGPTTEKENKASYGYSSTAISEDSSNVNGATEHKSLSAGTSGILYQRYGTYSDGTPYSARFEVDDLHGDVKTTGKVTSNNIRSGGLSTSVPANSYKDYAITFDTPMTETPYVTASLVGTATTTTYATNVNLSITGKSKNGFTIRVYNSTNGARNWSINWIAIS